MKKAKKNKVGRPQAEFTDEQLIRIDEYALYNCKDNQIAVLMGIDQNTFKTHFGKRCIQKRAEGQVEKLKQQYSDRTPTMLIWWGKQHLEQRDSKQEIEHSGNIGITGLLREIDGRDKGLPK